MLERVEAALTRLLRRGSRREYWIGLLLLFFVDYVVFRLTGNVVLMLAVTFAPRTVLLVRRLHDCGAGGGWAWLPMGAGTLFELTTRTPLRLDAEGLHGPNPSSVPLFVFFMGFFLVVGLRPGQPGENRFGPPPGRTREDLADTFS